MFTTDFPQHQNASETVRVMTGREATIALYNNDKDISITACGKLYKSTLLENIRFPEGKIHEDDYVVPIIMYKAEKACIIPLGLYGYRQRPNSIMNESFSLRRYDGVNAADYCISFFSKNNDEVLVDLATTHKMLLLFLYSGEAKKADIYSQISKEFKVPEYRLLAYLNNKLPNSRFTYYLAKIHPNWILPYEYFRKLKKMLGIRVKD